MERLFVRNPLVLDVTLTFSFKTLRYFFSGPWPLFSSKRLLTILLLCLCLFDVTSNQQYVLLHRHIISVNLNSCLKRPGFLLSCCIHFTQDVRGQKKATTSAAKLSTQSFDRSICHSALNSGLIQSSCSFSAIASYSESVSISNSSKLPTSHGEEIVVKLEHS